MPLFRNQIGINITNSKMQLVEINFDGEEFTLENVDEEYFEEFLKFDEKEIKILSILQNAYNELLMRKPAESKYASFTLPEDFFRVFQVPYDHSLTNEDLLEHFKWELSILYPKIPADDFIIQYITVQDAGKSNSGSAIVVALLKKMHRIISRFCSENQLILKFIDNAHFASDRLITLDDSIEKTDGVLSIYLAGKYMSVAYLKGYDPIAYNIIQINNLNEVVPDLVQELRSDKMSKFNLDIVKAFITGENVSDSLISKAENLLNIKFNRLSPFEKIKANPSLFDNKMFTEKADSFSSAAGIAYRIA